MLFAQLLAFLIGQLVILQATEAEEQQFPKSVRRPPKITRQSEEFLYALPEAKIALHCAADAFPSVHESGEYYWKKDGKYFNITEQGEGNESLKIFMPPLNGSIYFKGSERLEYTELLPYGGKYQCFAKNPWGTAMSREIDLRIATKSAPYTFPADEVLKVKEGQALELTCHKNAAEDVEIDWEFKPKTFQITERIAQTSDGSIVFSNVEITDTNITVYCRLKYLPTRSSIDGTHYTLSVYSEETTLNQPPRIVRPRQNGEKKIALKGGEIRLVCIATGNPTPSVYWTRDGEVISLDESDDDEERFVMTDFNRTLVVRNVRYEEAGTYTCTAENEFGLRRKAIELIVEAQPYFSDSTKRPTNTNKEPGQSATIQCEPEGKPKPEVIWLKNGQLIDGSEVGSVTGNRISLQNLKESDTGVYQCIGKNIHGTILGQGFLNVLESPPIPLSDNEPFYRKLEGKSVALGCEMFGVPQHTITWKKFGQAQRNLLEDERITMLRGNALNIYDLNLDDSGVYECLGKNKYGNSSLNITLKVLEKTTLRPHQEVYKVPRGDDVYMYPEVFSDPNITVKKIEWFKDGYALENGQVLTLLSVNSGDAGTYIILVTTEFDFAQTKIELVVQDVPDVPLLLTFSADVNDSFAGTLDWIRPNENNSPITGYIIEKEASGMVPGNWEQHAITPEGSDPRFHITDLKPWVTYRFRVWAKNEIGRSRNAALPTEPYKTPETAPQKNPTGVEGKGTSPDNLVISWNPVDPINFAGEGFGYEVSWCMAYDCMWEDTFRRFNETSYTVTGLPTYTKYMIKVRSANNRGTGPEPEEFVAYSGEDIPLEAPSMVDHQMGNDSDVLISWEPVPREKIRGLPKGYKIKAKDVFSDKVIEKTVGPDETATEMQLDPFTKYEVTVAITNSAGASDPSQPITIETPEGLPEPPENFLVWKRKLNELFLRWDEPAKPNGVIRFYRLTYEWTVEDEAKSQALVTNQNSAKLDNLSVNTTYSLTLCAKTSPGFGVDCAQLTTATREPREPREPDFQLDPSRLQASITWEVSSEDIYEGIPVRSYRIEHRKANNGSDVWEVIKTITLRPKNRSFEYTVENLTAGIMHEFRLVAANEYGEAVSNSTAMKTPDAIRTGGSVVSQLWFIVLLCIAALIILVIVIVCFMNRRKGGKYAVSEKEEQLVKQESHSANNEGGKYITGNKESNDTNGPLAETDGPSRPARLRGDSVGGNSIEAFGSGDTREYEEDGSFIDQYGVDRRSYSKSEGVSSPASDDSKDGTSAQTRLLPDNERAP